MFLIFPKIKTSFIVVVISYISANSLVHACGNSIANALELHSLQLIPILSADVLAARHILLLWISM